MMHSLLCLDSCGDRTVSELDRLFLGLGKSI